MEKYLDATLSPEVRAKDLLSKMSLDEKMGQVNCVFPFGFINDKIKEQIKQLHGIGQISTLDMKSFDKLEDAAAWQRDFQEAAMAASEHHIPATFHMEGLSGAFIQEATSFPSGIARGSSWDPALEKKVAEIVSRQELACGITQTLAPVLDISRDSRMGRQGETYGEDPALASAMGVAYTKGIQENIVEGRKTESVAKHFMGFHNSGGGIHGVHSDTPPRLLREIYGRPFQAAIAEANLRGIMPCYCTIDGEPSSASETLLTDILRGEMGFDGVCVGDYSGVSHVYTVHHVGESLGEAGYLCMKAGMDVEMPSCAAYGEELKQMFADGAVDMAVLDQAVLRVLTAKFRTGLFEHPFALKGDLLKSYMTAGHEKEVTLQSAKEGIILLKNDGALPLDAAVEKILVVGPHAVNPRLYFGGYTHISMQESAYAAKNSMAGVGNDEKLGGNITVKTLPGTQIQSDDHEDFNNILKTIKPECQSLLEVLREKMPDTEIVYAYGYPIAGNDHSYMDEALEMAKDADYIVMTLGGKYGTGSIASMGEGIDSTDINLPECQETFIEKAAALGKKMIGVHFDGRPISSNCADRYLDAIVEGWTLSEMAAEAVAQVLTGEYNPGGKLPVSVAYNAGQIPVYYNHPNGSAWHQAESIGFPDYVDCPHTPRYCFGHGLSYTEFTYTDLVLDKKEVQPFGTVNISCTVENTGSRDGEEVVQLYIRDWYASKTRPVKELAGFIRVALKAGEKKRIRFALPCSQLAFLDAHMQWKIEKGDIEVQIGKSSRNICLRDNFKITADGFTTSRDRSFYVLGQVL